jgi:hypothetical protein
MAGLTSAGSNREKVLRVMNSPVNQGQDQSIRCSTTGPSASAGT